MPGDVRTVQALLNQHRSLPLRPIQEDDRIGPETIGAIEEFQRRVVKMPRPDGRVDPGGPTFRALSQKPAAPGLKHQPATAPAQSKGQIAWGSRVSAGFKAKVVALCAELGMNPDFLMACMAFETGETFSPTIKNGAGSGAVGLIQFMPSTARSLGTTTEALAGMSAEAQLDYVKKYFQSHKGKLKSLEDVYMAILYPAAIGKPADYQLFKEGKKTYTQNKGFDKNKDGVITPAEVSALVRAKYNKGLGAGFVG